MNVCSSVAKEPTESGKTQQNSAGHVQKQEQAQLRRCILVAGSGIPSKTNFM